MEGKEEFLIEASRCTPNVGDIVLRRRNAGTGPGRRYRHGNAADTPRPPSLHYYQLDHAGGN